MEGREVGYEATLGHGQSFDLAERLLDSFVTMPSKFSRIRLLAGMLVIFGLATGAVWLFALSDTAPPIAGFELSTEDVEERIRSWGVWGVAGSIGLMIVHSFVPFPAEIVAMANGMIFGLFWGTAVTWTGAMLLAFFTFIGFEDMVNLAEEVKRPERNLPRGDLRDAGAGDADLLSGHHGRRPLGTPG